MDELEFIMKNATPDQQMVCCFFTNIVFGFFKKYAARLAVEKAIFSICLTNALLACELLDQITISDK